MARQPHVAGCGPTLIEAAMRVALILSGIAAAAALRCPMGGWGGGGGRMDTGKTSWRCSLPSVDTGNHVKFLEDIARAPRIPAK
eukprot:765427-Hanusia_phi.AAC.3